MASKRLTPSDAVFLYMESRETMMHVASMLPFTPPPDTPPDHLRRLLDEIRAAPTVEPPWNRKLRTPELLVNPLQAWDADGSIDLDYHLRRSALPSPGDERELGIVVSRLHSHAIDFHRPPWEAHLIEGLEGGRFAFYVKVHHSLLDGYTAMRILAATLSTDANDRTRPLFFAVPPPRVEPEREPAGAPTERGLHFPELMAAVRAELGVTKTLTRALLNLSRAGREDALDLVSPLQAPHSILNGRIGRARRFATQELETARLRALAKRAGGTLNDAILAICGTGLRRYLLEHGALPDAPLVAMMPVNIRPKDDAGGGNAVGGILASLATHLGDPGERLRAIIASTKRAKEQLQGMSKGAILRYSAILMSPFMLQLLPGAPGRIRPPFNLVVSNVPGPAEPLYFRGARLEGVYPMSIPVHGLALNITCNTYAGKVDFGFIGCRDTVPHLQRIAVHCGEALAELEAAVA